MQVAVVPVRVVERALDLVVRVTAVRDRVVTARCAVPVAAFHGRAGGGPLPVHVELVLVCVLLVRRVKVSVMQVVRVIPVRNGLVSAVVSVDVPVALVLPAGHESSAAIVPPIPAAGQLLR